MALIFVGRAIGKNKLLPNVSPGKTIEGVCRWGAVLSRSNVRLCAILVLKTPPLSNIFFYGVLSLVVTLASILGDLFESLHKRRCRCQR